MPRPLRVFLCHASQDKPTVRRLYRYLSQRSAKPWLDQEDLIPGQNWEVEIPKAIEVSDVILVCLSKNSVDKAGYIQKEISFALDKALEKPEGAIYIIPAKLEECDIPKRLSRYQSVDLFRTDGNKRLLESLRLRAQSLPDVTSLAAPDESKPKLAPKPPSQQPDKRDLENVARVEAIQEAKENTKREIMPSLSKGEGKVGGRIANSTNAKAASKFPLRWLGLGGLALFIVFGVTYLVNNFPVAVPAAPSLAQTLTLISPTTAHPPATSTTLPAFTSTPAFTATPSPTASPALDIGSTWTRQADSMVMVYVPQGEFSMGDGADLGLAECQKLGIAGCERGWFTAEEPMHTIYLDSYWIDQTEITNRMYASCVQAGACQPPSITKSRTRGNYYGNPGYNNYPVIYVEWSMANSYCAWAGARLPTEAEWEKAARGTDGREYPWGSAIPDCSLANFWTTDNKGCVGDTAPVGSFPGGKSIYGALDMAGNVWEWVSTLSASYPYDATDGREDINSSTPRIMRGGSWSADGYYLRAPMRGWYFEEFAYSYGFRCARNISL